MQALQAATHATVTSTPLTTMEPVTIPTIPLGTTPLPPPIVGGASEPVGMPPPRDAAPLPIAMPIASGTTCFASQFAAA
jgi:hypothetical protein